MMDGIQITIPAAAAGAIAWYAGKVGVEWLLRKTGSMNGTCKAGSVVLPVMDLHHSVLNEIKESNGEIRDGVNKLVTIAGERKRR